MTINPNKIHYTGDELAAVSAANRREEDRIKLVVIESPYSGNITRNEKYARQCMSHSLSLGEAPIASHLLYTQLGILDDEIPEERQLGIDAGLAWGRKADLVAIYSDLGITEGMRLGIVAAEAANIPRVYRKIRTA